VLDEDYLQLPAVGIARAVNDRDLSAAEVAEAALRRIEQVDGTVRAFCQVWRERARAAAREIDRVVRRGEPLPLAGVPVGLKGTEGTTSPQARRLLNAGAVPVGTTATPGPGTSWQTWGLTDRGPTLNPWNHALVPGGSSAGSAVAVATSMVPLATGSDGAGSVRIPAAWCGVLGLKPTNGTVPSRDRAGLNVGGALARHTADLSAYLDTVTGRPHLRATASPLRVTWSADLGFAQTAPEIATIARAALTSLVSTGLVEEVEAEVSLGDPEPVWTALRTGRSADGSGVRALNDRRLARIFAATDLLATPTTPNPPHGHAGPGEILSVALTWAFNLSGHPAVSVPAGLSASGTPVGLQLVARHGDEAALLFVAEGA
jgi:Asp-tRNA(Asn)/Glu-tRNA(Gln) amidotransferase A subunit family amidase